VECVPNWDPLTWSCPASAEPTYPGVYIEESPGGGRTIGGVSTCAAASIGFTLKGPIDEAVHVSSFADFERHFADVPPKSAIAQALEHYFLHGGTKAWVVRSASGTPSGSLSLLLYQPIDQSA
jgi:phage tail sheath protein FI